MQLITKNKFDHAAVTQALAANAGAYAVTFKPNALGKCDAQLVIGDVVHELPDDIAEEILAQLSEPPKPDPGEAPPVDEEGDPKPEPDEETMKDETAPGVAPAPAPASVAAGKSITISLNAAQAQADAVAAAVDERTELVRCVERVCGAGEPTRGRSNADLMRVVVAHVFDSASDIAKRSADAKCSPDYLRASFDSALAQYASASSSLRGRSFDALGAGSGSTSLLDTIKAHIN